MDKNLAFVLGGGGARGALQVGALKALLEAGYHPDLLVGTSIGAINAVGLALWGANTEGVDKLAETWKYVADSHLLDPRISRLILRSLMGLPNTQAKHRVENFLVDCGISRNLTFGQLDKVRLAFVAADLNSGQPVIYGENKDQRVHEGLFASIAIPPWFAPIKDHDHFIVDGGVVSNLPIEPALTMGATQIIALDLNDARYESGRGNPVNEYVDKLTFAVSRRLATLETSLAMSQGISIHRMELNQPGNPPMWDFRESQKLIQKGYEIAQQDISGWKDGLNAAFTPLPAGERPDNVDMT